MSLKYIKLQDIKLLPLLFVVMIAFGCSGGEQNSEELGSNRTIDEQAKKIYSAVPADVLAIIDIERLSDFSDVALDTSYVGYGLFDPTSPLLGLYRSLYNMKEVRDIHTIYALQYSDRNEVSFLQLLDFSKDSILLRKVLSRLDSTSFKRENYHNVLLREYSNGLNLTVKDGLIICSSSAISIESSLRHLANSYSILNNREFAHLLDATGGYGMFYLNHRQIGKIFSGIVTRPFLRYADFANRFGVWSAFRLNLKQKNYINLSGESVHHSDAINYATTLLGNSSKESVADEFLPASTVFAFALVTQGGKGYLKSYKRYLDANKKINSYTYNAQRVRLENEKSPEEWFLSENYAEVISAFCLVAGKYEWLTFTYKPSDGWFRRAIGLKKRVGTAVVEKYKYPGYIGAVLGEAFSHTNEESICKMGDWSVIGSSRAIAEFESGRANAITLERYLSRTPASSLFSTPYTARVWVNISEGKDTLLSTLKPYYRERINSSLKVKNFEFITVGISSSSGNVKPNINFYASNLSSPPQMFPEGSDQEQFFIDSTIKVSFAPHTLVDPLSGDTLYFEQSKKYLSIFLSNNKHKTLWGIPMRDTLRSCADFVTIGSKSYIAFAMGSKLYMISSKGAFANGYPKELGRKIAYGPKVIKENREYRLLMLDSTNVIFKTDLEGNIVESWKDIHAPEFTHNLPELMRLYGKDYYLLRTVFRTRIYTPNGVEIEIKDKKRTIAKDSPFVEQGDNLVRVMGFDGNEFLFNISNGKTKKL